MSSGGRTFQKLSGFCSGRGSESDEGELERWTAIEFAGIRMGLSWDGDELKALTRLPVLQKLWNPSSRGWRTEHQKFIFGFIVNSMPAEATGDAVSEELVL